MPFSVEFVGHHLRTEPGYGTTYVTLFDSPALDTEQGQIDWPTEYLPADGRYRGAMFRIAVEFSDDDPAGETAAGPEQGTICSAFARDPAFKSDPPYGYEFCRDDWTYFAVASEALPERLTAEDSQGYVRITATYDEQLTISHGPHYKLARAHDAGTLPERVENERF